MLKNCTKTELWKVLHSPMLYLSLAVGAVIALVDAVNNIELVRHFTEMVSSLSELGITYVSLDHMGYSLFALAMPYNGANYAGMLFSFVWPVLAAMPFGWSYYWERKSGLSNQLISRCGANCYYFSKYIAVFISGGLAVALPLLLNLLMNALICPYSVLSPLILPAMNSKSFLAELFFTHPWAHGMIWCCVAFLLGGAVACLCFCVGTWIRLQVVVMLIPFALLVAFDRVFDFVCVQLSGMVVMGISPLSIIFAVQAGEEWITFTIIGILTVLTFVAGYWQVVKHELA